MALFGLGAIGAAVARRVLPFGASVRALRGSAQPSPVPGVELVVPHLVDGADVLVVAAPLTAARGMCSMRAASPWSNPACTRQHRY